MLVFDIDNTLSPAPTPKPFAVPHEVAHAWTFDVAIPTHLLTFLRSREDIVLLSTWGAAARHLPVAFGFSARIAVMEDFTEETGIKGKFEVIRRLKPAGWADDHLKPAMRQEALRFGTATVAPKKGYITPPQLAKFLQEATPGGQQEDACSAELLRRV